jgi:hypothetical protein
LALCAARGLPRDGVVVFANPSKWAPRRKISDRSETQA